jgi:signal transduction histidine kinase
MSMLKSVAQVSGAAALIFALNGFVNFGLMQPLAGGSEVFNRFRYHLDDAVFVLLFGFVAIVCWAMFAVLPKEKGYLCLGIISFFTSLQLFSEWDGKTLLFGDFPVIPYHSLAIKSGIVFVGFWCIGYLFERSRTLINRGLMWASGILWAAIAAASLLGASDPWFVAFNRLFLLLLLLNMALNVKQFMTLIRIHEHQSELRWLATGFILFMLVLLPDIGKDVLENMAGRALGYRMVFWEQSLEDTFPWALLELVTVFGVLFFRRFVHTLKDNRTVTEQLQSQNALLEQEVDTRQRLDQLLSVLLRAYRLADLEQSVLREGQRYFHPHSFVLVKYEEAKGLVGFEGADAPSSREGDIRAALRTRGNRLTSGEAIVTPSMVLGAAGGTDGIRLFLAVCSAEGGPILLEERERFALLLMSKYVSIFYEYFQLLEGRLKEMEQRQAGRAPWLSKLFMQIAENERKRLASDLHDEVLQELLHIRRLVERTPDGDWLDQDKKQIGLGLDNAEFMIRETCRELMPSFLSDHGVLHAVSKMVDKTRLRADFQLEFRALPVTDPLSDEQTTAIYRVVQELINNAMKHSEADRVTLEVGQEDGALHIRYADDGKGMETGVDFSSTNRFGLRGIVERIRMVGGQVSVESEPARGMKVRCSVPL